MSIETRQIKYFVAVAEEHHFGKAAERLMMAQPPLSQQIRQLERSLGTELLTRTTRKVELNPAGELLLERGRRILEALDALEHDIKRVGEGQQGTLRLGFTGSATYGIMPRVVREASRAFDRLNLEVHGELLTPQLVEGLREQRLDVAVLRPPVQAPDIAYRVAAEERIVAALSSTSHLAGRGALAMADFDGEVLVGYPENSTISQSVAARWLDTGVHPQFAQRVSETSTLLSLVAAGIGAALVPDSATSLNLGGAVFRSIEDAPIAELAVAWRADDASRTVQRFLPFILSVIRDIRGVEQ